MRVVRRARNSFLHGLRKMDLRLDGLPREIGCLHARFQAMIFFLPTRARQTNAAKATGAPRHSFFGSFLNFRQT